jgi:hypothetical protein
VETGESCDDGNRVTEACAYAELSCTVCNASCQSVAGETSYCGDGILDASEVCDEGASNGAGSCSVACVCASGYHLEGGVCTSDERACSVPNGTGSQTWSGSAYSTCTATSCDSGYSMVDGVCLGSLGTVCLSDAECAAGFCLVMSDANICTQPCVTDCPEGFACAPALIATAPSTDICAPTDFCEDADGDTFGRGPACAGTDCDDSNARLNTVSAEVCDNRDNDCDGQADEQLTTDGDSCDTGLLGVCQNGTVTCVRGTNNCAPLHAAGSEICNGLDDDCDGIADDGFTIAVYFRDNDGDGFGDITDPGLRTCNRPANSATVTGDCNDSNADINPGATEIPGDDIDANCDGNELCFADFDDDGVRTSSATPVATTNCILAGYANEAMPGGDCDDTRPSVYPGANEVVADGRDNDCDGAELCFTDADTDGYRSESTISSTNLSCADAGEASSAVPLGDCDDNNSARHPGLSDTCDEIDNDCDGLIDEDVSVITFPDLDGDGYGDANAAGTFACLLVPGISTNNTDCNDAVALAFPGGAEVVGDGIDGDCDTTEFCYRDQDRDGYRSDTATTISFTDTDCNDVGEALSTMRASDCNDQTNALSPGRPELCRDGYDNNCNGVIDEVGFCI